MELELERNGISKWNWNCEWNGKNSGTIHALKIAAKSHKVSYLRHFFLQKLGPIKYLCGFLGGGFGEGAPAWQLTTCGDLIFSLVAPHNSGGLAWLGWGSPCRIVEVPDTNAWTSLWSRSVSLIAFLWRKGIWRVARPVLTLKTCLQGRVIILLCLLSTFYPYLDRLVPHLVFREAFVDWRGGEGGGRRVPGAAHVGGLRKRQQQNYPSIFPTFRQVGHM